MRILPNTLIINLTPRAITGTVLSSTGRELILHNYYRYACNYLELENLQIFNPTRLKTLIQSWIPQKNIPVFFTISGQAMREKIVSLPHANPTHEQLPLPHGNKWQSHSCYLYSHDTYHAFYLCSISHSLLFQCMLLALTTPFCLRTIIPERFALLHLYRYTCASAYRASQLALTLSERNHQIEQLFTRDDVGRIIKNSSDTLFSEQDYLPLLAACGALVSQG